MSRADVLGFSGRQRVIYGRNGLHFHPFFVRISASMALLFLPGRAARDRWAVWKGKALMKGKHLLALLLLFLFALSSAWAEQAALPASLTEIEPYAFAGDASLREVTLSEGVREIGEGAFQGCAGRRGWRPRRG